MRATIEKALAKLGPDHWETLRMMDNLAEMRRSAGHLDEARGIQEKTLAVRLKVLPKAHPETLRCVSNLAATLLDLSQVQVAEAERLQRLVLEARKNSFGVNHPQTAIAAWNLLNTLSVTKREREMRDLVATELSWLVDAQPGDLPADVRTIRSEAIRFGYLQGNREA